MYVKKPRPVGSAAQTVEGPFSESCQRGRSPSDWIRIDRQTCGRRMKPFHLLCAAPGRGVFGFAENIPPVLRQKRSPSGELF